MTPLDQERLQQALALATGAIGNTEPNPRVGCVIGREDGQVLGNGATQHAGGPHAEVMALRDAAAQGHDVRGATAWVTLEPCAHHGRTPPCCDALISAGLARVVVALQDPYPQVAGAGLVRMRAAGLRVDMADIDIATQAWDLNIGFFSRVLRRRPWLRVKVAASLDGRTALENGHSHWITGEAARADGHAWRQRASAVLTGIGTVLADNPRLDVRLIPSNYQPLRVVVDSNLRTPPTARVLAAPGRTLLVCAQQTAKPQLPLTYPDNAEIVSFCNNDTGRVDLHQLLAELARRGVNELHVEAGAKLNGALAEAGLVDEWLIYLAPKLLGAGRGMADLQPLTRLDHALQLQLVETRTLGNDIRLRLRQLQDNFKP